MTSAELTKKRRSLWILFRNFLRANFLAGVLVVTPLAATIFFMRFLLQWVDKILLLLPPQYRPEQFLPFPIPGLGLILLITGLLLIGFLVRNFLGRRLVALGEKIMSYIPFVSKFYMAVKQLVETIFFSAAKDFKRVVLVEYPRKGLYSMAFVTGVAAGEIQVKTEKRVVNIFLPTTPNPTSGFYLMVPEEELIPLEMPVETAFKILISGGILNSEDVVKKQQAELDKTKPSKEADI